MNSHASGSKIVIVCALKEEFAAVEKGLSAEHRGRFELIRAGVGQASAARVAKELAVREHPPELIVSTGFCGGLIDELKMGGIVVSGAIVDAESGRVFGNDRAAKCAEKFARVLQPCAEGKTVCTREPIIKSAQKRELAARFGAVAVDMESAALAAHIDDSRTGVLAMRAISDAVSDELPAEVGEFLDENGRVRIVKITRFVLKHPRNIARLMGLKKRSDIAAAALTKAWRAIGPIEFK